MPVKNLKTQNYGKLVKQFKREGRTYLSNISPYHDTYYISEYQVDWLDSVRSGNINKGSIYAGLSTPSKIELVDSHKTYSIRSSSLGTIKILQHLPQTEPVIVAYNNESFQIVNGYSQWLEDSLNYFYDVLQEYDGDGNPLYPEPKDFEIVIKSPNEPENIWNTVLIVMIGSGAIEILTRRVISDTGQESRGEVFHRFLTEGWASKYGNELNKKYYTDTMIGDNDYLQGDENRNAALAALAPVVLENAGVDAGNINNSILENLKFLYYTKPLSSQNTYAFSDIYSFDGASGSVYSSGSKNEIYIKNISSTINDISSNNEPILYNVYMEIPQSVEDFDYLCFKLDFETLMYLKDPTRSITSYINNNFTGENFDIDSTSLLKINNKVLFDSIGIMDLRYYDKKLKMWNSTNIVQKQYYQDLYTTYSESKDPLRIIRNAIEESSGYTSSSTFSTGAEVNYNPFFDYGKSSLTVYSDNKGSIDYQNVIIKLFVRNGFKSLIKNENIELDENAKLNYALVSVDNIFEIEDKSVFVPEVYGKKLIWFAVPPVLQHVGGSGNPSLSQFRIYDDVYSPADITINYGAPLYGKFPVDIFRILKSIWIE